MTMVLGALDYAPMFASGGAPAMVTVTLPGDWETVAPSGRVWKRMCDRLWRAHDSAWGTTPVVWKQEFQGRGAPHLHGFLVPPTGTAVCRCRVCGGKGQALVYREWLSHKWAAIVAHPDPAEYAKHLKAGTGVDYREGGRSTDVRRLAVYFSKHGGAAGGKEYQHQVPEAWQEPGKGPGRFWGYRHLEQAWASADVPPHVAVWAARTLRRWSQRSVSTFPGQPYPHRVESHKGRRLASSAGFVMPANGPALLSQLVRFLDTLEGGDSDHATSIPRRERLQAQGKALDAAPVPDLQ